MRQRRGVIHHVPPQTQRQYDTRFIMFRFKRKDNTIRDSSYSALQKTAIIRYENFLQSVCLFCNKKKVFANKPSICIVSKNRQVTDKQPFIQNSAENAYQKHAKTPQNTTPKQPFYVVKVML